MLSRTLINSVRVLRDKEGEIYHFSEVGDKRCLALLAVANLSLTRLAALQILPVEQNKSNSMQN